MKTHADLVFRFPIERAPDGQAMRQFHEVQINQDVSALRNAVSELQALVRKLARNFDCKDC